MARKKIEGIDLSKKLTPEEAIHEMVTPGVPIPAGKENLAALWHKVQPFLLMAGTLFGKKVAAYVQAFSDAIDEILASEDTLEESTGE